MKEKILLLAAAAMLLLGGQAMADGGTLTLLGDYATFYIPDDSTTYVEFYYSLYRHQLGFVGSEDNPHQFAGVLVSANVYNDLGDEAGSKSSYFLSQIKDKSDLEKTDYRLFDYLPIAISPGHYRVELSAIDDVSKATGSMSLLVDVPDYSAGKLSSSDLELAYDISEVSDDSAANINSRLVKEGRLVVPNPTGVFQPKVDTLMYVYSELYGLTPGGPDDKGFIVEYSVKDPMGNVIHDFGRKIQPKPGTSAVLANALDIRPLEPGQYHLILNVEDPASGQITIASRRFSLVDPNLAAPTVEEKDVQLMQNIAWFHLSEAEKIRIQDLSPDGRANMIRQFWRNQDDTPGTPDNAVYDEAVRRYAYTNENFSTNQTKDNGWRTDRGRVYITYGPPNEVEEYVMSGKSYPYYKWTYYDVAGGCVFVFVNDFVAGAVDYRLVHSTHPREKYDSKWQAILEEEDSQDNTWKDAGEKEF